MTITTYKHDKKTICHIKHYENKHIVCTGKPSDASCISWTYTDKSEAEKTAKEYFENRTTFFKKTTQPEQINLVKIFNL